MEIITKYSKIDSSQWSEFVLNHPDGNIFQSPEMVRVFEQTKNYEPITIFAFENNEIKGILVGVIQKEFKGLVGYLSSRCIIFCGPIVKDNNLYIIKELLNHHNKLIKKKAIYSQIRNLNERKKDKEIFDKSGYFYEPHLNIHINLKQGFDSLKQGFHKSKLRNYTKSINKGVYIKQLQNLDEIKSAYEILKETYSRIKLPTPDFSHFKAVFEYLQPKNFAYFLGMYFNEQLIGFRVTLTYKNIIHDYYAGNVENHSNKYPNDVLVIELIKWGCSENFEYFDFGGAGKPNIHYGVRDFKLKFSSNLFEPGRFQKIHRPVLFKFAKTGFEIWKRLK